jgi:hypothetical protein
MTTTKKTTTTTTPREEVTYAARRIEYYDNADVFGSTVPAHSTTTSTSAGVSAVGRRRA